MPTKHIRFIEKEATKFQNFSMHKTKLMHGKKEINFMELLDELSKTKQTQIKKLLMMK